LRLIRDTATLAMRKPRQWRTDQSRVGTDLLSQFTGGISKSARPVVANGSYLHVSWDPCASAFQRCLRSSGFGALALEFSCHARPALVASTACAVRAKRKAAVLLLPVWLDTTDR
jgi:hypothetical protein